jgi:hypothetical protein
MILEMDLKLRDMDTLGIDVSVFSHCTPHGPDALDGAEADL